MYKLLLCWRYLLTRYLALVCIVSVMLGVATLIVVNSVMSGFSTKLRERLHGLLSDIVVESRDYSGFYDPDGLVARIRKDPYLDERIEAMSPAIEIFAMIQYGWRGQPFMRSVKLIGIDPEGRARIGGFAEHLVLHKGHPTFELPPAEVEKQRSMFRMLHDPLWDRPVLEPRPGEAAKRPDWAGPAAYDFSKAPPPKGPVQPPPEDPPAAEFEPPAGIIVGHAIAHFRFKEHPDDKAYKEECVLEPGHEVVITTVSGQKLAPVNYRYVVTDYLRSEMSEYDSQLVFVPLKHLQKLRAMEDQATSIQIRLKGPRDAKEVEEIKKHLEAVVIAGGYGERLVVNTWEQKQGALLAAIRIEKGILNVLLFLIVGVAGFGILAIFSMIVVEKTRDIGILKALGASNGGVMKIFLGYGLLLGLVGAALGTGLGVTLTVYINRIEGFLGRMTGMEIFPRDVYYFNEIPTDIQTFSVALVNVGAVVIAVVFSILPALRAAMLHPVRALRYE